MTELYVEAASKPFLLWRKFVLIFISVSVSKNTTLCKPQGLGLYSIDKDIVSAL